MEETSLELTDDALRAIAAKALKRDVGARALRAVFEDLMLDLMYELPEQKQEGATYEITGEMVDGETLPNLFAALKKDSKKESA
jgi:ATP-dependent Clp protease ATP-binding subunit ClpX